MLTVASFTRARFLRVAVSPQAFPTRTHPGLGVGGPPGVYGRVAMNPSWINSVLMFGGCSQPSVDICLGQLRNTCRKNERVQMLTVASFTRV